MLNKKTQTATEYLIILAVVIVIALIVVGVLGGIPSIGGGAGKSASNAEMLTADIGITNYHVNSTNALIIIRNNKARIVNVDSVSIDGWVCNSHNSDNLPKTLSPGESKTINCDGIFLDHANQNTVPDIGSRYTDIQTDATYTTSKYKTTFNYIDIGDEAGGGYVFYIDEANGHDWNVLVAAPSDATDGAYWGPTDEIGDTGEAPQLTVIGTGQENTDAILAYGSTTAEHAPSFCDVSTEGGYDDWFFPSKAELNAMWCVLQRNGDEESTSGQCDGFPDGLNGVGGFSTNYWSSSEVSSDNAWYQDFNSGGQSSGVLKANPFHVRCARAI
ncbi:MAG: DUF1566 domain-containing protein [Nanobdellota archaeon]